LGVPTIPLGRAGQPDDIAGVVAFLCSADASYEILPGLTALPNGGHTPGHQSVLVQTGSGETCVCGDIVSLEENLEVIGAVCPDREGTARFLARAREAGWQMLPSHDARLRRHVWYLGDTGGHA
jgi:glyoxylase-like metal-dependent hydrolase (beta-lactamase superfamily II)